MKKKINWRETILAYCIVVVTIGLIATLGIVGLFIGIFLMYLNFKGRKK